MYKLYDKTRANMRQKDGDNIMKITSVLYELPLAVYFNLDIASPV